MSAILHRFWFKFADLAPFDGLGLGCGVTAHSYDDALQIMQETVFADRDTPKIECVVEDVDVATLDQDHVIPNMEPPIWRGIWFPKGYVQWQLR